MKYVLVIELIVSFVLVGLAMWSRMSVARRRLFSIAMLFLLPVLLGRVAKVVIPRLHDPPTWDIRCFWVWGRIALTTHSIYDPASSLALGATFPYDPVWVRDFLAIGFIYPPPTILLFAPLGLFRTPQGAAALWYAINLLAMLLAIVVLWRAFLQQYGLTGLLATALLVLTFSPTYGTLFYGQPMTIMLLVVALYAADRWPVRRGAWLGVAFIVKPVAVPLLLLPLLRRAWVELGVAISTIAAGFAGAVLLVGWNNVLPYFTNPPSRRYPLDIWLESENQSLFSAVVRIMHQPVPDSLLHARLFLVCAIVATLATVLLCAKAARRDRNAALSLLIALALLVFPPSASFYSEILLVPLLILWDRAGDRFRVPVILYTCGVYALFAGFSMVGILAPLSIWVIFAWIVIGTTERAAPAAIMDPPAHLGRTLGPT